MFPWIQTLNDLKDLDAQATKALSGLAQTSRSQNRPRQVAVKRMIVQKIQTERRLVMHIFFYPNCAACLGHYVLIITRERR